MEENKLELLWNYYKKGAEIQGRRAQEDEHGNLVYTQLNFSLLWFFQRSTDRLAPIARAFLGDEAAMESLPWDAAPAVGWEPFALEGPPLNKSQSDAIRRALTAPLSFIQGPPGTGKTETILNLASCAARTGTGHSVAIVSSNNSALDNIEQKIRSFTGDLPNKDWLRQHFARLGSAANRAAFQDQRPVEEPFRFSSTRVTVPADSGNLTVSRERAIRAEEFLSVYPVITSTIHSLKNCFQDGPEYIYDYVIMDESSQTDVVAGILAMSCARHLVLVGDPKQLPPVVSSAYVEAMQANAAAEGWAIPPEHVVREERSFLDVCLDVFKKRTARTTLRFHYRCHPGIIGFCAQEVYKEEKLKICTPTWDQSVRTPIKVLWFAGDYCERGAWTTGGGEEQKVRYSKHNRKQLQCFMEEEWPLLRMRLQGPEPPSVCILSPFRGQLSDLKEAIQRADRDVEVSLEGGEGTGQEGSVQEPSMLTIHKSQGREFDIVYLLPVEDGDWEWPWSQQKRLINVAVSRARRELRVVLSSVLMEQEIQEELLGWSARAEHPRAGTAEAKDQLYLQKLVRYVQEANLDLEWERGTVGYPASTYPYGFHRSARTSIFDEKLRRRGAESGEDASSPERCMTQALLEVMNAFREERGVELALYTDVPIQDIRDQEGRPLVLPEEDREVQRLVKYGGHFDFLLCQKDRILLAIEVDGSFHRLPGRSGQPQRRRDGAKNRLMEHLKAACFQGNAREGQDPGAEGAFAFLRLPDDGSTCLETRALWRQAGKSMRNRYFPIEELVEARLDCQEGYRIPNLSITSLLKSSDDQAVAKSGAPWANGVLERQGLTGRRMYQPLGQPSLAPTGKGRSKGIVTTFQFGNGKLYRNAVYPASAQEEVLRLLSAPAAETQRQALPPDMPVECLLENIYDWFDGFLRKKGDREEQNRVRLRLEAEVSFDGGGQDCSTQELQALYLLHYLYGYAYEYKKMYRSLLERMEGRRLSVTSIGCGSMVDYWSLRAALAELPESAAGVDYVGVDINDWAEAFRIRAAEGDTAGFVREDAASYLRKQAEAGAPATDLYVFPKSLSGLDGRDVTDGPALHGIRDGLRDLLRSSPKDRVALLFSLRSSRSNEPSGVCDADLRKVDCLRGGVEEAGFRLAEEPGEVVREESAPIRLADGDFVYPGYIMEALWSGQDGDGVRRPVTRTDYVRYQILFFRRKGA